MLSVPGPYSSKWWDVWWTGKDLDGSGSSLIKLLPQHLPRAAGVPARIQTKCLPNAGLAYHHYTNLFGQRTVVLSCSPSGMSLPMCMWTEWPDDWRGKHNSLKVMWIGSVYGTYVCCPSILCSLILGTMCKLMKLLLCLSTNPLRVHSMEGNTHSF